MAVFQEIRPDRGAVDMHIDELSAHIEIRQVLMTYCRGVDRGDEALIASVYHEGALDKHGSFQGTGADFAPYIVNSMDQSPIQGQHIINNVYIDFDGDEAKVESYFIALHPYPGADGQYTLAFVGGRYLDDFAFRHGRWAITDRSVVFDWTRDTLPGDEWAASAVFPQGGRREADPSHAFFQR